MLFSYNALVSWGNWEVRGALEGGKEPSWKGRWKDELPAIYNDLSLSIPFHLLLLSSRFLPPVLV
jgi:hypothetical protein